MLNADLNSMFQAVSTAIVSDACVKLLVPCRANSSLNPITDSFKIAGKAFPVRHYGSVDILLEAIDNASAGEVLVIDNQGRMDEACIGDLIVLEAKHADLSGIVVWGCHRDTTELLQINFPVYSLGACPAGPKQTIPRSEEAFDSARIQAVTVTGADVVLADDDGILFVSASEIEPVLLLAKSIASTEQQQSRRIMAGEFLREQLQFQAYLDKSRTDSSYTFRQHLLITGGEIEA